MDTWIVVVIVAVLVVLLLAGLAYAWRRRRGSDGDRALRERFGSEYDRELERAPDRATAEQRLAARVERHERLDLVELSPEQRDHHAGRWHDLQRRFIDEPEATLGEADRLITQVMRDRGYPTEHFDQKVEDLSVEHARTVDAYREANAIADRHERGGVSTEELRLAMQRYRTVFEDLVGQDGPGGRSEGGRSEGAL